MKVLFIGEPSTMANARLGVTMRWSDTDFTTVSTAMDSLSTIAREQPDLVFLEHQPGDSRALRQGIEAVRELTMSPLIVIGLPGPASESSQVEALESGADDFLPASAGSIELLARVAALLRRINRFDPAGTSNVVSFFDLWLDPSTYEVTLRGQRLNLTSTEFRLLHLLVRNRGAIVSHRVMEMSVWGDQFDRAGVLKKYIGRLREKLALVDAESLQISNVRGVGYRLIGDSAVVGAGRTGS